MNQIDSQVGGIEHPLAELQTAVSTKTLSQPTIAARVLVYFVWKP